MLSNEQNASTSHLFTYVLLEFQINSTQIQPHHALVKSQSRPIVIRLTQKVDFSILVLPFVLFPPFC